MGIITSLLGSGERGCANHATLNERCYACQSVRTQRSAYAAVDAADSAAQGAQETARIAQAAANRMAAENAALVAEMQADRARRARERAEDRKVLADLQEKIAVQSWMMTPAYPAVQALERELALLETSLAARSEEWEQAWLAQAPSETAELADRLADVTEADSRVSTAKQELEAYDERCSAEPIATADEWRLPASVRAASTVGIIIGLLGMLSAVCGVLSFVGLLFGWHWWVPWALLVGGAVMFFGSDGLINSRYKKSADTNARNDQRERHRVERLPLEAALDDAYLESEQAALAAEEAKGVLFQMGWTVHDDENSEIAQIPKPPALLAESSKRALTLAWNQVATAETSRPRLQDLMSTPSLRLTSPQQTWPVALAVLHAELEIDLATATSQSEPDA